MKSDSSNFANDLAEVLELKLLGFDRVGSESWVDYAYGLLSKYHKSVNKNITPYIPLWRSLYRAYNSIEEQACPYVVFSRMISAFCDRIEVDFPLDEIDRDILISYLRDESKKALLSE
jgi:hypothetical protein